MARGWWLQAFVGVAVVLYISAAAIRNHNDQEVKRSAQHLAAKFLYDARMKVLSDVRGVALELNVFGRYGRSEQLDARLRKVLISELYEILTTDKAAMEEFVNAVFALDSSQLGQGVIELKNDAWAQPLGADRYLFIMLDVNSDDGEHLSHMIPRYRVAGLGAL